MLNMKVDAGERSLAMIKSIIIFTVHNTQSKKITKNK